jgi:hypothetical protein
MNRERYLGFEIIGAGLDPFMRDIDTFVKELQHKGYDSLAAMPMRYLCTGQGTVRKLSLPIRFWCATWDREKSIDSDWKRTVSMGTWAAKTAINTIPGVRLNTRQNTTPVDLIAFPRQSIAEQTYLTQLELHDTPKDHFILATHSLEEADRILQNYKHHIPMPEIHGNKKLKQAFFDWAEDRNQLLTLDTWHVRNAFDYPLGKIGLIHFQPSRTDQTELDKTLLGQDTYPSQVLQAVKSNPKLQGVVVEHQFPLKDQLFHRGTILSRAGEIAHYLHETILS